MSHPTWVRGLKLAIIIIVCDFLESHPTWVRGLKRSDGVQCSAALQSHPTWVRGLKHDDWKATYLGGSVAPYVGAWIETGTILKIPIIIPVAPYVGAWIETIFGNKRPQPHLRRTLRGCVD